MSYVLMRSMKVQKDDGTVELRQPGDPCPEAAKWPNPGVWVRRGYIKPIEAVNIPGYDRGKLKPMKEATAEDAKRGQNAPDQRAAAQASAEVNTDAGTGAGEGEGDPMAELMALSRGDLNALAEEHGIEDPHKLPNKEAVASAILEAQE